MTLQYALSTVCTDHLTGKRQAAVKRKKRVMVLMSDTGGGHRASAEALQAGFEQLYGDDFQVSQCSALACGLSLNM